MAALHDLDHIYRQWLSVRRLSTDGAVGSRSARARAGRSRARPPSLPPMSLKWRLEHELAASKHREDL